MDTFLRIAAKRKIILATGSPARRQLLENLGLQVPCVPSQFKEDLNPADFATVADFVEKTAYYKTLDVAERLKSADENEIVIGADTMIASDDGVLLGKPKDAADAAQTLSKLSGRPHTVHTGVAIKYGDKVDTFSESAKVYIGNLTKEDIQAYISTGEPMNKAGSYGIQGMGSMIIEKIEGDYYTVVGLPLYRLAQKLKEICKEETDAHQ